MPYVLRTDAGNRADGEPEFYSPHYPVRESWQAKVNQRLAEELAGIDTSDYRSAALRIEERRLRPISREADVAFRRVFCNATLCDWVYADNRLLDIHGRLSVESKLNGRVFIRAVAQLCGRRVADIRDNNYGTRLGAGDLRKTAAYLGAGIRRRVGRIFRGESGNGDSLVTTGSWINYGWYIANSPVLRELWEAPSSTEREWFADYLSYDPWTVSMNQWSLKPALFYQLLTARLWSQQRRLI